MERDTKIFLGLIGLTIGVVGISFAYNINKKPKIESYDNLSKSVIYKFRGATKTTKLDPSMATQIGRYSITPMLDDKKQIIGAEIKDENGSIVDSMYSSSVESESSEKKSIDTNDKNFSEKIDINNTDKKQDNSNKLLAPIYPVISPAQVGTKEWNNIRKLSALLVKKVKRPNWISSASADENKRFFNNFKNYVTHNEYNILGKFLATYNTNETKTISNWSDAEKKSLRGVVSKISSK